MSDEKDGESTSLQEVRENTFSEVNKLSEFTPALREFQSRQMVTRGDLSFERYEAVMKYIRAGTPPMYAAFAVGVSEETLNEWLSRGYEEPDSIYSAFLSDFNRSLAFSVIKNIGLINRAARDDWKAADRLNAIIDPDRFGNKATIKNEITGLNVDTVQSNIIISNEELKKLTNIQELIDKQNEVVDAEFEEVDDE